MTIKEVEEKTGLTRSNIRFYEKENLIEPSRTPNGYRDYSQEDLVQIQRIAFLRSIEIPVETIRSLQEGKISLNKVLRRQEKLLDQEISQRKQAKAICTHILEEKEETYASLEIDKYVYPLEPYITEHKENFRLDAVSFMSIWGSRIVFAGLTLLCLMVALLAYGRLPENIPVKWSGAEVTGQAGKWVIFAYPAGCIFCYWLVRPAIWRWLRMGPPFADIVTDYLTNFLCVMLLSVEIFTLFYLAGILVHVTVILVADAVIFLGMLMAGMYRVSAGPNKLQRNG